MKKNIRLTLVLMITLGYSGFALAGKLTNIEEAIESEKLSIKMSKDLTGVIRGKICDRCEVILVSITPDTKLFVKGKQVDLSKASTLSGKPGTATFNIKTKKVTKIYSYE